MRLRRPSGSGWSAVAALLVASLAGVPQALQSAAEPEHRCQCPAGERACSCPRCAATSARARPPCHGGAAPGRAAGDEIPPPPSDAPCVSSGCGGTAAAATQPGGVDPFVLREDRARTPPGRPERFAPVRRLVPAVPAAPEPPPPRA